MKEDLDKELEKVAETRNVSMRILLKQYQSMKEQLSNAEDEAKKKSEELAEERKKYVALHERLARYNEENEIITFVIENMKKDLLASEETCTKLTEENEYLKQCRAAKNETDAENETPQVNCFQC